MVNTLEKLREVEANLALQEESLNTELAELQSKLKGIKSVLPMFSEGGSADEVSVPAVEPKQNSTAAIPVFSRASRGRIAG